MRAADLPDVSDGSWWNGLAGRFPARKQRLGWPVWLSAAAALVIAVFVEFPANAATIHVNTTQQGVTNGQCSLQEAIYASEFKASSAIDATDPDHTYTTGCEAGTGDDTIELPSGATFSFDHFWDGDAHNITGPTATPVIFSHLIIEGNGAKLVWTGAGNSRLFAIAHLSDPDFATGTGALTLRNVYVKGFHVKGGDGGLMGGGGGLGAGGAIYVIDGMLTVEGCTFDGNGAVGGNGASCGGNGDCNNGALAGGGGGGLSGNGGNGGIGSGGGGGGSRGDGGQGGNSVSNDIAAGGGGGGGTVFTGADGTAFSGGGDGGAGGYRCGGSGGGAGNDGDDASCPGAGGGGGGGEVNHFGNGGQGAYGGGGAGGVGDGGHGGFGGGGGGGRAGFFSVSGGDGGFGGGGGGVQPLDNFDADSGAGGKFGGRANETNGGGGGALGGAIFNHNGTVIVRNSTFTNNYVTRGNGGGGGFSGAADNGADAGGAIFSLDNTLEITDSTFSNNQATGSGGAIAAYSDEGDAGGPGGGGAPVNFIVRDTIIANNGASECFFTGGAMFTQGAGNLIMMNGSGSDVLIGTFNPCPGVVSTSDPELQPLQVNSPGLTPTLAILVSSPAHDAADAATSLSTDQRGVSRPQGAGFDIGAYEARPPDFFFSAIPTLSAVVGGTVSTPVDVNSFEYFDSPVKLVMSMLPAGISASLNPTGVTPPVNGTASSTLKLTLAPTVTPGTYTPEVTGTSLLLQHSAVVSVVVKVTAAAIANVVTDFVHTGDIDSAGVANALSSKLSAAQSYISVGDLQDAMDVLGALINQVQAQSGKHIKAPAAAILITDTKALQASL
jgi:hypothetical protein